MGVEALDRIDETERTRPHQIVQADAARQTTRHATGDALDERKVLFDGGALVGDGA